MTPLTKILRTFRQRGAQQQTRRRPLLLSIDGTVRRTDRHRRTLDLFIDFSPQTLQARLHYTRRRRSVHSVNERLLSATSINKVQINKRAHFNKQLVSPCSVHCAQPSYGIQHRAVLIIHLHLASKRSLWLRRSLLGGDEGSGELGLKINGLILRGPTNQQLAVPRSRGAAW